MIKIQLGTVRLVRSGIDLEYMISLLDREATRVGIFDHDAKDRGRVKMAGENWAAERAAALDFLFGRIDYERNAGLPTRLKGIGLQRMHELLQRLGNPHHRLPVIHVAGTKGKGSTASMIASILNEAGYRVGLYTSPHLERLEERFVLNGQICGAAELVELVSEVRPAVEAMDAAAMSGKLHRGRPTFFEITTAMAMSFFARQAVDLAVLEVGMGGRLDSTNVCHPIVCVITSISLDHTRQLGDTEPKIAGEKAGIIKPGVPVVSGATQPDVRDVIRTVAERNAAPLWEREHDFFVEPSSEPDPNSPTRRMTAGRYFELSGAGDRSPAIPFQLRLLGRHQLANAAVAIAAVKQVDRKGWPIAQEALQAGLAKAFCPARIELVRDQPQVIVDTAHNVASIQALIEVLHESLVADQRILIFAATREKDSVGMLRCLLPHFDHVILTRYVNNPRGVPPEELGAIVKQLQAENAAWSDADRPVSIEHDPNSAWLAARALAQPNDLICITGSLFLAGELRSQIHA